MEYKCELCGYKSDEVSDFSSLGDDNTYCGKCCTIKYDYYRGTEAINCMKNLIEKRIFNEEINKQLKVSIDALNEFTNKFEKQIKEQKKKSKYKFGGEY